MKKFSAEVTKIAKIITGNNDFQGPRETTGTAGMRKEIQSYINSNEITKGCGMYVVEAHTDETGSDYYITYDKKAAK